MNKALSVPRVDRNEKSGCITIFFSLFMIMGLAVMFLFSVRPLWSVATSSNWVETPCSIISSDVGHHGDTYSIDLVYEYIFGGDSHIGNRYSFLHGVQSSDRSAMQTVVNRYPPGSQTKCYVDPDSPQHSVLDRSFSWHMLWGLAGLPFLAVGLGGLIRMPKKMPAVEKGKGATFAGTNHNEVDSGVEPQQTIQPGKLELTCEFSPGKMLLGIVVFAIIWNGFFAFLLFSSDGWFDVLFSIPFWLFGIALICWSFYCLAAMFNPWPTLTLDRHSIPLGETANLAWQFQGDISKVERLTISVKGEEHARFMRGTDRHTDKEAFYQQNLAKAENGSRDISSGAVELNVPSNTMHSFKSENNAVVWVIEVYGKRRFRPEINLRFPIQVRPLHVEN